MAITCQKLLKLVDPRRSHCVTSVSLLDSVDNLLPPALVKHVQPVIKCEKLKVRLIVHEMSLLKDMIIKCCSAKQTNLYEFL